MSSDDNRLRRKWQDYGGFKATKAEHAVYEVFETLFKNTDYELTRQPKCFSRIYLDTKLSEQEAGEIYNPPTVIKQHGIKPDCLIRNNRTGKTIFIEIKRQDGWVEGKQRKDGRGNAHERFCKYFTPGLLKLLRKSGGIADDVYPFWVIFVGDVTRDPCHVREIRYWFDGHDENVMFWRNTEDYAALVNHFEEHIAPILD